VCQAWALKYGWPVFQIRLGNMRAVVVNTFEICREMLLDHSNQVIDRPTLYTFHGVVSSTQGFTLIAFLIDARIYDRKFAVR
jgi:phenylacetate 2-hydroxylase